MVGFYLREVAIVSKFKESGGGLEIARARGRWEVKLFVELLFGVMKMFWIVKMLWFKN